MIILNYMKNLPFDIESRRLIAAVLLSIFGNFYSTEDNNI